MNYNTPSVYLQEGAYYPVRIQWGQEGGDYAFEMGYYFNSNQFSGNVPSWTSPLSLGNFVSYDYWSYGGYYSGFAPGVNPSNAINC